jgi:hypothetical protein
MSPNTTVPQLITSPVVDVDCPQWVPEALDPEPEKCWCLSCGEPLPCPSNCQQKAQRLLPRR